MANLYDQDYFINGVKTGKSLYSQYRWMPELTIPFAHSVVQHLGIKRGQTVLDYGCACGYLVKALRLLGIDAYGVDISDWALSQAPRDVEEYVMFPWNAASVKYDYVIAKDVLEHLTKAELARSLKPLNALTKQALFAVVPLGEDKEYIAKPHELDETHRIREDIHWWRKQMYKAGFKDVRYTYECPGMKEVWTDKYPKGIGFLEAR